MGFDDKNPDVISMEPVGTPSGDANDAEHASIIKQTRTRRLFTASQLFSFTLVYMNTWLSVANNIYFVMQNGGPRAWLFSYIIVVFGVLCQVISLAEISSLQPIAGAQYYWTYTFAPGGSKKILTWLQGWVTWLGYVALLAAVVQGGSISIHGLVNLGSEEGYTPEGWHTFLMVIAYLLLLTVINLYAFWIIPWIELVAGILNTLLFFVTLIVLWVMAPRNSMNIFLQKSEGSGWGDFVSFNVGSISAIYLFIAFECTVHMGEETRNPKRAVPASMFWGFFANMTMGFIMIFTYGIALPPVDDILSNVNPFAAILTHATGSNKAAQVILALVFVSSTGGVLGVLTSVSRLTWAWARDGGLPKYFAIVSARTRVPERAVWGTALVVAILNLLNLNGEAFIAFGAIVSLTNFAVYCSYAILLACVLHARFTTGIEPGEWSAGKNGGIACNIIALIYTVYEMIWLVFPAVLPVEPENMNYAGPVFGFVFIGALSWWFLWARHHWAGPNMKVLEIVLQNDAAGR